MQSLADAHVHLILQYWLNITIHTCKCRSKYTGKHTSEKLRGVCWMLGTGREVCSRTS